MADWIIAHDGSIAAHPPMSLECQRCHATLAPSLPIAVDVWAALARIFQREHRRCKETVP